MRGRLGRCELYPFFLANASLCAPCRRTRCAARAHSATAAAVATCSGDSTAYLRLSVVVAVGCADRCGTRATWQGGEHGCFACSMPCRSGATGGGGTLSEVIASAAAPGSGSARTMGSVPSSTILHSSLPASACRASAARRRGRASRRTEGGGSNPTGGSMSGEIRSDYSLAHDGAAPQGVLVSRLHSGPENHETSLASLAAQPAERLPLTIVAALFAKLRIACRLVVRASSPPAPDGGARGARRAASSHHPHHIHIHRWLSPSSRPRLSPCVRLRLRSAPSPPADAPLCSWRSRSRRKAHRRRETPTSR